MIERWIVERSKDLASAPYVLPEKVLVDTQNHAQNSKYYGERFLSEFIRRINRGKNRGRDVREAHA
jgi:hypothetical protein